LNNLESEIGSQLYEFAEKLWPFNRSLTGNGVRQTLGAIKEVIPELRLHEVSSGEKAFDWIVPKEWNVADAYLITPNGNKICDFKMNNLHLVGYSIPIRVNLPLEDLQKHLHSLPDQKDAIPYVTSYYEPRWGFCLSQNERDQLIPGIYKVHIDVELVDGSLTYGEILLPGQVEKEILLSTYICHPMMANNELSGIAVTTYLAKWLSEIDKYYSYRIVFLPETIGSIVYISKNLATLKKNIVAGYVLTCIGDERTYSFLPSRLGDTLGDRMAMHVMKYIEPNFKRYRWLDRGSDERQYCSPKIDLPVASIMRTKYGEFPEYHTSLDRLDTVVTATGLAGGYELVKKVLLGIENNYYPESLILCEPQMGKRGLYATLSQKGSAQIHRKLLDALSYCDGNSSLLEISDILEIPIWEAFDLIEILSRHQLVEKLRK
jgi:aminopeptidase-like protein